MKVEDVIAFRARYGEATTPEGKLDALADQMEATGLCNVSTRMHLKTLETDLAKGLSGLAELIEQKHGSPRFRDDPLGWLRCNYQWIVIFLLAVKAADLGDLLGKLFALGGTP